jgi:hypothetical protein
MGDVNGNEVLVRKARAGYERTLGLGLASIAGAEPLTWAEMASEPAIVENLVEKTRLVLSEPLAWIHSDDLRSVEFALGVIFDGDLPGTAPILWAPSSKPFFDAVVRGVHIEMRVATVAEAMQRIRAEADGLPSPYWFFGKARIVVFRTVPLAYIEARVEERLFKGVEPGTLRSDVETWERDFDAAANHVAAASQPNWGLS